MLEARCGWLRHFLPLLLPIILIACATPRLSDSLRYNVELTSGKAILCQLVGYDSTADRLIVVTGEGERQEFRYREVVRVTEIATPVLRPEEFEDIAPCDNCYECPGRPRCTEKTFTEVRLGAKYRGSGSYTRQTQSGPEVLVTETFTLGENGTTIAAELQGAWGFRFDQFRVGIMSGIMPSDGSWFVPVALHARYDFSCRCAAPNVFLNLGIPIDFQTGTPLFVSDFSRQRKYFGAGFGYEIAMSPSLDFAVDAGYQYITVPLSEIDCCPEIPADDRFPARNSHNLFVGVGVTF